MGQARPKTRLEFVCTAILSSNRVFNARRLLSIEGRNFGKRYVQVDDGRLYYEVEGEGPALVMIHAGFLDSRMWDSQFKLYSKNYRVIRYDVRGFGKSDIAKTKFSDHRDLYSLLKHLRVGKTSLLGVSNGGRIALDFAVEYPEMVEALVLVAPGASGYNFSGPEEEKLWEEFDKQMKP